MKQKEQTFWLLITEVFMVLIGGLIMFAAEGISSEVETIARLKGFGLGLVMCAITINVFVLVILKKE